MTAPTHEKETPTADVRAALERVSRVILRALIAAEQAEGHSDGEQQAKAGRRRTRAS